MIRVTIVIQYFWSGFSVNSASVAMVQTEVEVSKRPTVLMWARKLIWLEPAYNFILSSAKDISSYC